MKKLLVIVPVLIVVVLTAIYIHFIFTVHTVIPDSIYRSAQLSCDRLQKNIDAHRFKTIINLRGEDTKEKWYQEEADTSKKNNVKLYNVRLSAYKLPVSSEVDTLAHILQTAEKPILLHCQAGADRSGMASALALSIEEDAPLSVMEKQYSWRYFVNPFRAQSSGKLFFSAYKNYLRQTGVKHSRKTLLSWINNQYIDYKGNIEFVIELANNERFRSSRVEDRRSATIHKDTNPIVLRGWAVDYRRKSPVNYFSISVDGKTYHSARFTIKRPDVANYYHLSKDAFKNFTFGWIAVIDVQHLKKGCYVISLRAGDNDTLYRSIKDAGFDLCIK